MKKHPYKEQTYRISYSGHESTQMRSRSGTGDHFSYSPSDLSEKQQLRECLLYCFLPLVSQQSKKWSGSKQYWNWSNWTTCTPNAAISTQSFGLSASTCYPTLLPLFLSKCTVGLWFHGITQIVFLPSKKCAKSLSWAFFPLN